MEGNIEVPGDSDISDGWSIVDYKSGDVVSHLRASTDSGLCSETLVASQQVSTDDLAECFELTEILDPLGVLKLDGSDIDSDGISIISDDEENADWKQKAHLDYTDTLKLLETPTREAEASVGEIVEIVGQREATQLNLIQFVREHLLASAVIVAIACIALAQYFKTDPSMEKLMEMLDSLEKLKMENQKLQIQLQSLTLAYSTLKAKILPELDSKPIPSEPTTPPSEEILQLLETFSHDKDPKIRALGEKLQKIPSGKMLNALNKLVKRKREVKKLKKKREGLKIVQWYPEEAEQPVEYFPKPGKKKLKKLKSDCENQNKTGSWYLERGKSRESSRKSDEQKEWQFAKGRRDLKREDDEKSMWYLRRLELHARTRQ